MDLFGGRHAESSSEVYDSAWSAIWMPVIPTTTYPSVSEFYFGFSTGIYTIDYEYLSNRMAY